MSKRSHLDKPCPELKPCPFCGSSEIALQQEYGHLPMFFVGCDNCGASASYTETEEEAIEAWNERKEKPP